MKVSIYTDGAARGNPDGPGGYGVVLEYVDPKGELHVKELSGGYVRTTNNRMELMAVIRGLEALNRPCEVELYSDSQYVVNAFNQHWIEEKLASGQIRNIGFSYHGNTEMFKQLVDAYDWDFCQIQYNYIDEYSQAGVEGLRYANAKGLPVIIMEPLRGGRLVNLLPESAKELFRNDEEGRTPAELALKWLYNQPEVTCVLSGMNSMEMVEQNVKTASESHVGCLTTSDAALIEQVKEEIKKHVKVGCTGCGYCMPCPRGVDIPGTFRCYNAMYSEGKKSGRRDYLQCTAFRKDTASASQCIGCGKCETHCPQHLEIRKELKCAASELEDVKYKVMKSAIRIFKLW